MIRLNSVKCEGSDYIAIFISNDSNSSILNLIFISNYCNSGILNLVFITSDWNIWYIDWLWTSVTSYYDVFTGILWTEKSRNIRWSWGVIIELRQRDYRVLFGSSSVVFMRIFTWWILAYWIFIWRIFALFFFFSWEKSALSDL